MLFVIRCLFSLCLISPVFAQDAKQLAEHIVEDSHEKMQVYLNEAEKIDLNARLKAESILKADLTNNQNGNCGCRREHSERSNEDASARPLENILIFISFSMPKECLKNLYEESKVTGAALILRGLKNNSFKETADIIKELEIVAQIDPELFEKYQIRTVPTFVLIDQEEPVVLKGNVTLSYAKAKFKEINKGDS